MHSTIQLVHNPVDFNSDVLRIPARIFQRSAGFSARQFESSFELGQATSRTSPKFASMNRAKWSSRKLRRGNKSNYPWKLPQFHWSRLNIKARKRVGLCSSGSLRKCRTRSAGIRSAACKTAQLHFYASRGKCVVAPTAGLLREVWLRAFVRKATNSRSSS